MATNEPMTDARLAEIREQAHWAREVVSRQPDDEGWVDGYANDMPLLLAEVDRLRAREQALAAENAVMRPMVDAVAEAEAEPMQLYASEGDAVYVAELAASEGWEETTITIHVPRDTYERARAFVAAHPTAAGEAESEGE